MTPTHFPSPEDQIWTLVELRGCVRFEMGLLGHSAMGLLLLAVFASILLPPSSEPSCPHASWMTQAIWLNLRGKWLYGCARFPR